MPNQMMSHVDLLEQEEPMRTSVIASLGLHALVFSSLMISSSLHATGTQWGDPHALGGGSVGINAVSKIPLRSRSGLPNPLANDTESRVPQPPKAQARAVKEPEPDAIPIRGRKGQERNRPKPQAQPFRPQPDQPNQVYSDVGQALASPLYGAQTGTAGGAVGVGPRGSFGQRFGWYRDLLEQRVAQKWRTDDVDPRLQTAPPVIVTFDIMRDGQIRNVRVLQASGNHALDYSTQRAIYEAAPFPQLPQGYDRDSAQIEFWFQLKR